MVFWGHVRLHPPQVSRYGKAAPKESTWANTLRVALPFFSCTLRKHPWRLETIWNLYTNYQASHSVRPYLMTFWYHRPYHFCHSPVSTRPEEDDWPWPLEVPVEVVARSEGWATELTVPRFEGVSPNAVASSAFLFASCCALARSDCFFFSSICLRYASRFSFLIHAK